MNGFQLNSGTIRQRINPAAVTVQIGSVNGCSAGVQSQDLPAVVMKRQVSLGTDLKADDPVRVNPIRQVQIQIRLDVLVPNTKGPSDPKVQTGADQQRMIGG